VVAIPHAGSGEERVAARADLEHALRSLSAEHRLALMLRYLDGLPVIDVARSLDRSVAATESLLARARRALAAVLQGATL
jgi:DNA-directed RNA polymerase specialized sigma24 family protein